MIIINNILILRLLVNESSKEGFFTLLRGTLSSIIPIIMTEDYKFDSKVVQQFSNEYQDRGMLK